MSKRLTKTIWYGSDVDSNGNPILPSTHGGLDGLNYGELFLHLSNGKATLWTLSSDGKIVEITGGGSDVDMSSYLLKSIWDKVFEIRTDSQGTEYIFGKLPVVTQYGITMYSGDGVDVPSLASGLPFDGRTIWYNPDTQQIEVIGGTGGGSGEGVSNFWDLSGIPSWITNSKPKYTYSEIEGTPDLTKYALASQIPSLSGYATESWVNTKLGGYLPLNGNASSATKLQTAQTIWGQPFDGTGNVSGILSGASAVLISGEYGIYKGLVFTGGLTDNDIAYYANIHTFYGNVGIGTTKPTSKLHVNGDVSMTSAIVNGGKLTYDNTKKYWKLEGDLLVTGGVTMYGSDSSFTPSTIMNAILYDSATLGINSNGQLYVKGGTSGGGFDITALQNYLTQNSYLNVTSGDNRYLKLSGGTLTGNLTIKTTAIIPLEVSSSGMGYKSYISYRNGASSGEDMGCLGFYGKNIPSFRTNSSDGGKEYKLLHENNYSSYALPLSGGTITGTANVITINRTDLNQPCISYEYNGTSYGSIGLKGYGDAFVYNGNTKFINKIWHEGNLNPSDYLLLTGGTIKGQLTISRFPSTIFFLNAQGVALGYIGYGGVDNPVVYMSDGATNYNLLHSGNIDSYNAGSATKLATARTIWGQSFDGTDKVDGSMIVNQSASGDIITFNDTRTTQGVLTIRFDRNNVDYGGINWFHDGYNNYAYNSTSHINIGHSTGFVSLGLWTSPLLIADIDKKCVGINNATPEFALDVNGSVHSTYIKNGDAPPIAFPNYINSSSLIYQQWYTFVGYNGKGFIFGQDNTDSSIARLSIYGGDTTMSYLRIENAVEVSNNLENGSAVLRMCMNQTGAKDQNPNIEFMKGTAYIDWHYAGDTSVDYTTRLIEGSKGILTLKGGFIIDNTLSVGDDAEFKKRAFIKNYVTFSDLDAPGGSNSSTARIGTFDHNEGGLVIQLGKNGTGSTLTKQRFEIINPAWNVGLMWVDRNGNMFVNGGITMYSDKRKKTILNHVELSLKQIADAPLIEHYYNSDEKKTTHVGTIAQYWASINDWFCKLDSEGFYTMEIQNAALASAISIARELDRYETKTDKAIKKLKMRICELEEEVERLRAS